MSRFIVIFFISTFIFSGVCSAASVSLVAPARVLVGDDISVAVVVDTGGTSINSLEAIVTFDPDTYSFSGFLEEESVVGIWIERPKEVSPGRISFSGIVPGGVDRSYDPQASSLTRIVALTLRFTARSAGERSFDVEHMTLFRNDGKGTALPVTPSRTTVLTYGTNTTVGEETKNDISAPEPFTVEIVKGVFFGRTPPLALFQTKDAESGVARYEVSINGRSFREVTSPYEAPRRIVPYVLTIRAVDFSGNTQLASVRVDGSISLRAIIVGVVVIGIFFFSYRNFRRRKRIL